MVVFESVYGNTHDVARAVAQGLAAAGPAEVRTPDEVTEAELAEADLLVVGGPTHVHGMTRDSTRASAIERGDQGDHPPLDEAAGGTGLRTWFESVVPRQSWAAAFDTRLHGSALLTGRASKGIAHHLEDRGYRLLAPAQSFIVDKHNRLEPDELTRARIWGEQLAAALLARGAEAP